MNTPEEIQKIKETNKKTKSLFNPVPAIFFIIGITIAAMVFKHTMG